jgi:precorrin-2 dehydrogenase/sirohydrochlorin ferrochelatase
MSLIPIFVEVAARRCLIVGGGTQAARKARSLVAAGAAVTVVSTELNPELDEMASRGAVDYIARGYQYGDMSSSVLVYAATNDSALHNALRAEADERNILINVVDGLGLCSFIVPAVFSSGDLKIAVSTGGASPALARNIRDRLGRRFGPEYAVALKILRAARTLVHRREADPALRARILDGLASSPLLEIIRSKDTAALNLLLMEALDADLRTLGIAEQGIIGDLNSEPVERRELSPLKFQP